MKKLKIGKTYILYFKKLSLINFIITNIEYAYKKTDWQCYKNLYFITFGIKSFLLLIFSLITFSVNAQNIAIYTGNWEGKIADSKAFSLTVEIKNLQSENAIFKIFNSKKIINNSFKPTGNNLIFDKIDENLSFKGLLSNDKKEINGFIKSGFLLYHLKLVKNKTNSFVGVWNILMVNELFSKDFYLSIENGSVNNFQAYPIFADNRFTGTWCGNFKKNKGVISFFDFKTGLLFKGVLLPFKIRLGVYLGDNLITNIDLRESQNIWKIENFRKIKHGGVNKKFKLDKMESLILKNTLANTHSVLISKKGKIIYEKYFYGYTANIPHDMRSASKSISSAIVGIAKDKLLFDNVNESIFDFLPEKYQINKGILKSKIDIKSLLTMSSGLDADDYTVQHKSFASEKNYQPTRNWTKTILEAPMINEPNTHANYGLANPYLLGIAMDSAVSNPLELFMDKSLFQKLKITNYIIQTNRAGIPYFGGGMYLTPKDMIKFGELYLNKGTWNGKRILSKKWIKNSFKNYHVLENIPDKNGYGYLWYHNTYYINGSSIKSMEARGNGGQYIFVIPKLKVVVVITSGNYINGKTQQPELILKKYILPHFYN